MKKLVSLLAITAVLCALLLTGCGGKDTLTLNIYNWGEYISDGSDDSFDTIREFEKWYEANYGQKLKVNYDTYASNEDMYSKISSGAVSYDVIIPSDYMIARMIAPTTSTSTRASAACTTIPIISTPCPTPTAWSASSTTPTSSTRPTPATGI